MFSKLYEKIKDYLKENYKFILFEIFVILILIIPLPYYVNTTGGIINVDKYISVKEKNPSKGSYNLAYVSSYRATLPTYLLTYIMPNWDLENIENYTYNNDEDASDISSRGKLELTTANNAAIEVAYDKANKTYEITNSYYNVVYIDKEAETTLKVGDMILEFDGKKLSNLEEYSKYITDKDIGYTLKMKVKRKDKEVNATAKVVNIEGQKMIGLSIYKTFDYNTNPDIDINFSRSEEGPSGGFMTALAIYDKLIDKDLTHGLKIVGTGTIDSEGNVGTIDGVKYKLRGAVKHKADIFFVPSGSNYNEAIKLKKKYNYKIKVIKVKRIDDAINYLDDIK